MRRYGNPLVPWAVGHVGLVQKPAPSGLYLRRMLKCPFCDTLLEDGQECEACNERRSARAVAPAVACCSCGDREFVTRLQDERWWKVETRDDVRFYCNRCLPAAKERALQAGEEAVYA